MFKTEVSNKVREEIVVLKVKANREERIEMTGIVIEKTIVKEARIKDTGTV